jgi:hypothetical protein
MRRRPALASAASSSTAVRPGRGAVSGCPGTGNPASSDDQPVDRGEAVTSLTAADFNGDGLADVLVTRTDYPTYITHPLQILLNNGHGRLSDGTSRIFDGAVSRVQKRSARPRAPTRKRSRRDPGSRLKPPPEPMITPFAKEIDVTGATLTPASGRPDQSIDRQDGIHRAKGGERAQPSPNPQARTTRTTSYTTLTDATP